MRSLRGRLTLGVCVVLAVVLGVSGVLVSREVERTERAALDDRLQRTAELSRATAIDAVQNALPGDDDRLDAVLSATRTSVRLTLGGQELYTTGAVPPSRADPGAIGVSTFVARDGQRFRQVVSTLREPSLGGLARLEVTAPLGGLEARQGRLDQRLLALGGGSLLLAGFGTWLAAELVLRPLRRLRGATATIAGTDDLDRRVPESDGSQEIRGLARSFNGMLARLGRSAADRERALSATRRFAADAGHELRTPLTSVQATLSAMHRHPDMPAASRAGLVADALTEHHRLVALLDGLQALARGDAVAVAEEDVDLAEVVDVAVSAVRARHTGAAIECEVPDAPVVLRGWEAGLRLLVDNLVLNAVRHGGGGRVRVELDATSDESTLVVEDDGPGVPEAQRDAVFAPFARVAGTGVSGSGLGLALVAQQAEQHGATVVLDASPSLGGARVTVAFRRRR